MQPERRKRLEALPGWAWDGRAAAWDDNYALLVRYVKRHKGSQLAYGEVVDGVKLGQWAHFQRQTFAKGKLSRDRLKRLEALPHWTWNAPLGGAARRR
jgi:hypothetical protein